MINQRLIFYRKKQSSQRTEKERRGTKESIINTIKRLRNPLKVKIRLIQK